MNDSKESTPPVKGQFLVFQAEDGRLRIDVRLENETAWLTQSHMAELFQTTIPNVSMHLRNIFADRELQADSVVQEFLTTAITAQTEAGRPGMKRGGEHGIMTAIPAFVPVRSANGAVSYQPGVTPQDCVHPSHQGPTARHIAVTNRSGINRFTSRMERAFSPQFVVRSVPGTLPQAGMRSRHWCSWTARDLEQTIAGNVTEILET